MKKNTNKFNTFREFWPFYISQHKNRVNRLLHVTGSLLGFTVAFCLFYEGRWVLELTLAPIVGYGLAWTGHFLFEKNRPATFKMPIYSFLGDLKMIFCILTRQDLFPESPKKTFFITGAGRGIGLGLVRHFLQQGHQVFAGARVASTELTALQSQFPLALTILALDVRNSDQISASVKSVLANINDDEFILINNAGVSGGGPFELMTEQHWLDLFGVNVHGLVNVTRAFLPLLRKSKGKIINIGSISGRITSCFLSSYSASKYAVRAINDGLRRELAPKGVSVVLIEPGPIATDIWNTSMKNSLEMIDEAALPTLEIYRTDVAKLERDIQKISKSTVTVDYLVSFIDEAAKAKKPKPYYRVGKNIGLVFTLAHFLPAYFLDRLLRDGLRFKRAK